MINQSDESPEPTIVTEKVMEGMENLIKENIAITRELHEREFANFMERIKIKQ